MIFSHLLKHMANPWVAEKSALKIHLNPGGEQGNPVRFLGFVPRPGHPGGSWAFVQDPSVNLLSMLLEGCDVLVRVSTWGEGETEKGCLAGRFGS